MCPSEDTRIQSERERTVEEESALYGRFPLCYKMSWNFLPFSISLSEWNLEVKRRCLFSTDDEGEIESTKHAYQLIPKL